MRQLVLSLLASLLMLVVAGLAMACANDREAERTERKFRSQYNKYGPEEKRKGYTPGGEGTNPLPYLSVGAVLLIGAGAMCLRGRGKDV